MQDKRNSISQETAAACFWNLFDFNAVSIITWNFDGSFITANDAYLNLVGYSRQEFEQGKVNWRGLTPPEYLHLDEQCIRELETKGIAKPYEKEYIHKNGSRVKIRLYNALAKGKEKIGVGLILPIK